MLNINKKCKTINKLNPNTDCYISISTEPPDKYTYYTTHYR